jgi:hypothetical protein
MRLYDYNLSTEAICLVLIDVTVCWLVVSSIYVSISRTCAFIFQIISVLCGCGILPGTFVSCIDSSPLCNMVLGTVER